MTVRQMISQLQAMGYSVQYRERSKAEGTGVRITKIGDKYYKGSKGNILARDILKQPMSVARSKALEKLNKAPSKRFGKKRLAPLEDAVVKEIRRIQRLFRQKGIKEGKPTIRNYRYVQKVYGTEEANRLLKQTERYGKGFVYLENVKAFRERIQNEVNKGYNIGEVLNPLDNIIAQDGGDFTEIEMKSLIESYYDWTHNNSKDADSIFVSEALNILRRFI